MAIFHLSVQVIGRNQRLKNTIAAAAYRSASKLSTEDGCIYDYRTKQGVVFSSVIIPEQIKLDCYHFNREKLWNEIEKLEKRKDAQLAYEINIALPIELNQQENIDLACTYIRNVFSQQSIIVDLSVHYDNIQNPHMHIMLPFRALESGGDKVIFSKIRMSWAEHVNQVLEEKGIIKQITHLSNAALGVDKPPTKHKGISKYILSNQKIEKKESITSDQDANYTILIDEKKINRQIDSVSQSDDSTEEKYDHSKRDIVDKEVTNSRIDIIPIDEVNKEKKAIISSSESLLITMIETDQYSYKNMSNTN